MLYEVITRIENYIEQGVKDGASLVVDGRGAALQGYEGGHFCGGSLFDNASTEMSIYQDEIFGPVLTTVRVITSYSIHYTKLYDG